jgi:hypothetical protein
MRSSWEAEKGYLACHWYFGAPREPYNPSWMQKSSDSQGSYLPPLPPFSAHSPFGGASWFRPYPANWCCK